MQKGAAAVVQVLIKWVGLPAEMSSWEDYTVLKDRFPDAIIWSPDAAREGECHDPGRMIGLGDQQRKY